MREFIDKYKVVIFGLLISILQPVLEFMTTNTVTAKGIILCVIGAAFSWFARNFRGQFQTIVGILQLAVGNYIGGQELTGQVIAQIVLQIIIAYLAASTSNIKSRGYEHTETVVEAKREGEILVPTIAPPPPIKI